MKKSLYSVGEYRNANQSYSIVLNNIGLYEDLFKKLCNGIKTITPCPELFFGHYKVDGINLSRKDFQKYRSEIQTFFEINGDYKRILLPHEQWKRNRLRNELTVCRTKKVDAVYQFLDKLLHYYQHTIFFCPKVDWRTFVQSFESYMEISVLNYVMNGFTDFLFSYSSSQIFFPYSFLFLLLLFWSLLCITE